MNEYSKLKELAKAAGGVDWKWWDSNSTLRLTTERDGRHGADGDAISAYRDSVQSPEQFRAFIEAASPAAVLALIAESETRRVMIKEMDLMFGRYILAMRSAIIEEEHGKGAVAAMEWIYNSLVGPGQLPPDGETDAQAYFDREIVAVNTGMQEVLAFHDAQRSAKKVTP